MNIQIGTIAFRDKKTTKFINSQPLLVDETQELLQAQNELITEIIEFMMEQFKEIKKEIKNNV